MTTGEGRLDAPAVPWAAPRSAVPVDTSGLRPAGVWRRAAALGVDAVVGWLLLRVGEIGAAALDDRELVARAFAWSWLLVAPAAYVTLAHGTGGQTLGKWLLGARVVTVRGEPIGYPRALARYLAWWLALLPLGAGHLAAAARHDRRALHDLVAGTRVVRTGPLLS